MHKNGKTTNRDSIYLAPVEVENGLNHQMGTTYGQALLQDTHEFYSNSTGHKGSPHCPSGVEQHDDEEPGFEKRGVGLDFAILDSAFLISQVILTLFMGMIVQFAQSVTAYMACSSVFGALAIYFGGRIVYDQKDLKGCNML